jgi:hypothetical protein
MKGHVEIKKPPESQAKAHACATGGENQCFTPEWQSG